MTAGLGVPGALILAFLTGWLVGYARHVHERNELRVDAETAWTAAAEALARTSTAWAGARDAELAAAIGRVELDRTRLELTQTRNALARCRADLAYQLDQHLT